MDVFMEYLIKHKRETKDNIIIAAIAAAAVLLTIILLMVILVMGASMATSGNGAAQFSSLVSGIGLLLVAGVWYGVIRLINQRNIEYEYILTNSEIDIDKIMAKRGRKRIVSFDFKDVEIMANITDNDHNSEYRNVKDGVKVYDLTGNKANGNVYFADVAIEGEQVRILIQPTSKMLESIKKYNPRKIFVKED